MPTTVANEAPEFNPNNAIAIATANSKKLLAPIIEDGAHVLWLKLKYLPNPQVKKNMKKVEVYECIVCYEECTDKLPCGHAMHMDGHDN